jgi:hypothetical protein
MNRYILITITVGITKKAFVADISNQNINEDWTSGAESIVRRQFPRFRTVQEVLEDTELGCMAIAAEIASVRMFALRPWPGHNFDSNFQFSLSQDFTPVRPPDESIGRFPIWHL